MSASCNDCGEALTAAEIDHGVEGYGHEGRCCECAELVYGAPIDKVNARRAQRGRRALVEVPR